MKGGASERPVVEVGAVGEISAAQLAGFPDVSQAVDQLRLHWVVLTQLVEVLPGLTAPVGADLLTHVPVDRTRWVVATRRLPSPPPLPFLTTILPAEGCVRL